MLVAEAFIGFDEVRLGFVNRVVVQDSHQFRRSIAPLNKTRSTAKSTHGFQQTAPNGRGYNPRKRVTP